MVGQRCADGTRDQRDDREYPARRAIRARPLAGAWLLDRQRRTWSHAVPIEEAPFRGRPVRQRRVGMWMVHGYSNRRHSRSPRTRPWWWVSWLAAACLALLEAASSD